jgi:hypothetical protein
MNPGDVLEGQGQLLEHGRLIATVSYHLSIPHQTHFIINPTGRVHFDYDTYLGGFILLRTDDAEKIRLATNYTLELANKSKKTVYIERRYKKIKREGQEQVSFWVKVSDSGPKHL